jgi:hypothetical protein
MTAGIVRRSAAAAALVMAALVMNSLSLAHHSVLQFDRARGTAITGTVTAFAWENPHAYIHLDVPRGGGGVEHWSVESESPRLLARLGWTERSIDTGDRITVLGARAKDGSRAMRCKQIELGDGRTLACFVAAESAR